MKNRLLTILDTKMKKMVAIVLAIAILSASGFGIYTLSVGNGITISLKKDILKTVEYGESITSSLEDYLDLSKLDKVDKEKVLKESKLTSNIKNEDGKEYPGIGDFEITITYKDQKLEFKVEVKDSVAPVFNEMNEVSFEQGTEFDYVSAINATDLQRVEVTFDTTAINKDVPGDYIVKVIAKDKSNNEATKDIKVIVTAKPVEKKPTTNNGGANTGTGAINKPSSSGTPSNKPSTGGSSSSGGTSVGGTTTPLDPHIHANSNSIWEGYWFDSESQADAAAEHYIDTQPEGQYIYNSHQLVFCKCGKIGVIFHKQ